MTVADDLATLRFAIGNNPKLDDALKRVEAEIARLQRHPDAWSQQAFDQQKARAEAAEGVARLRDGLRPENVARLLRPSGGIGQSRTSA